MTVVLEMIQNPERSVPDYLEFDTNELKGKFVRVPRN